MNPYLEVFGPLAFGLLGTYLFHLLVTIDWSEFKARRGRQEPDHD